MLSACAFTPHEVKMTASAPTETSTIGKGITLNVEVHDDRDSPVVGQRGAGMHGADITAPQVIPTLEREFKAGLEAKGFTVQLGSVGADAEIEARLRAFKFFIETGFFVGAENTSVVVAIEARKSGREYNRTYRVSDEEATMFVPEGASIDEKLNAPLLRCFRRSWRMQFLAERPPTS
jgi:uncharacterized lipoprotein YajG